MKLYEIFNGRIGWYEGTAEQADNITVFDKLKLVKKAYKPVLKAISLSFEIHKVKGTYKAWMHKEQKAMDRCMEGDIPEWNSRKENEVA